MLALFTVDALAQDPIKIACVGNSITKAPRTGNYPELLQRMLDSETQSGDYEVKNLGRNGACVTLSGVRPYLTDSSKGKIYDALVLYKPHWIVLMLGTNDSKGNNWDDAETFEHDYNVLLNSIIEDIPSLTAIWLCTPPASYNGAYDSTIIAEQIRPIIKDIAVERGFPLIDVYDAFHGHNKLFGDGVHPTPTGRQYLTRVIYNEVFNQGNHTLLATDDATLNLEAPETNSNVSRLAISGNKTGILKFDLSGISDILTAHIRCRVAAAEPEEVVCRYLSDDSWDETTVTASGITLPTDEPLDTASVDQAETWVTFNVTRKVRSESDGTASFVLSYPDGSTAGKTEFHSNSTSYTPELVVVTKAPAPEYTLTLNSPSGGTVSPGTSLTCALGTKYDISATADPGHVFTGWTVVDGAANISIPDISSSTTTIALINGDATLSAGFSATTYELSVGVDDPARGTLLSPASSPVTVAHGANTTIEADPAQGFRFSSWTVTGGTATIADASSLQTTVALSDGNASVQANFEQIITHTLTVTSGSNGSVTPSAPLSVEEDQPVSITATPGDGFQFKQWIITSGEAHATISNESHAETEAVLTGDATLQAQFELIEYELTVSNDGNGSTQPAGNLTVEHGVGATIEATSADGYEFAGWQVISGTVSFSNRSAATTTIVLEEGAAHVQASFALKQYELTLDTTGSGSVEPSEALHVGHGTAHEIAATPAPGYRFSHWTITSGSATLDDPASSATSVTLTQGNATVTAVFQQITYYSLTVTSDGNGTVEPSEPKDIEKDSSFTISAQADDGFQFVSWAIVDGTPDIQDPSSASTAITLSTDDATVQAMFEEIPPETFTLTVISAGNGTVSPSGDSHITKLESAQIIATPANGYSFAGWDIVSGSPHIEDSASSTTQVTLTSGNATVQAAFEKIAYDLTIETEGSGTAEPSGTHTVTHGTETTVTASPAQGYRFVRWETSDGTSSIEDSTSMSTTVTLTSGDAAVRALFTQITYSLTVTNNGNGTTDPSGMVSLSQGDTLSITATPSEYYRFVRWTVSSGTPEMLGSATSATNRITLTDGDASVQAEFAPVTYTLTVLNSDSGTIEPSGESILTPGDNTVELSATPLAGYEFGRWLVTSGESAVTIDTATKASALVTVTSNATVKAEFNLKSYTCTILPSDSGSVMPTGDTILIHGSGPVDLSAEANTGYGFLRWAIVEGEANAEFADSSSQATTAIITGDVTIQAVFDRYVNILRRLGKLPSTFSFSASASKVRFAIPDVTPQNVSFQAFDLQGHCVLSIRREDVWPGYYSISIVEHGVRFAPGLYVFRMVSQDYSKTVRLTIGR